MELTGLQQEIWKSRYAFPGEQNWSDTARRVANAVAKAENDNDMQVWADKFYDVINNGYFIPGGRIIRNSGRKRQSLINCFISELRDDVSSIGDFLKTTYMVGVYEGGFGYLADVRPLGAPIANTNFAAPGIISTVTCIDNIGKHTRAGGGRRGAIWAGVRISHPDVWYWVDAKKDLNVLNNHNISIVINDTFLRAVEEDKDWDFEWNNKAWHVFSLSRNSEYRQSDIIEIVAPDSEYAKGIAETFFKKHYLDTFTNIKKIKIKAKSLWQKIINNASHDAGGEPGIINESLIQQNFIANHYTKWIGLNGCQPSWATVLTPNGLSTIKQVDVGDVIWSGKRWTKIIKKWSTGIKKVYAYKTTAGIFYGTENHQIISEGERVLAADAETIDICNGPQPNINISNLNPQDIMDGLVIGDGSIHKASNNLIYLLVGNKDQNYHESEIKNLFKKHRPGLTEGAWEINTTIVFNELPKTYNRSIPERFRFGTPSKVAGFLRGLFSANGSICAQRITLRASSFNIVQQTQEMLSVLGIKSYITTSPSREIEFNNGIYECKESYDVNISVDRKVFQSMIGFIQDYKTNELNLICEKVGQSKHATNNGKFKQTYDIISKEFISEEEVFDLTVEADEHTYWTGGLLVSNCTEVTAGGPHDVCCLGHLNLSNLYDPETNDLNYQLMQTAIHVGIRFLDNVLTINDYPLQEIKSAALRGRRIGLGFTGFAHLLIKMGIRYGSSKCINFMNRFMATIRNESFKASIELAKEKGAYPVFDVEKYLTNDYVKQLPASIKKDVSRYGIRNVGLNLLAPCGTISVLFNTSSSLEPIFAPVYKRKYRKGEILCEDIVIDPLFEEFLKSGNIPDYFVGAYDVSIEEHLKVLSAAQSYCDQSISKTSNISSSFSDTDLSSLVLQYIPFIKGLTLYREGSRPDEPLTPIRLNSEEFKKVIDAKYNIEAVSQECLTGVCEI